MYYLFLNIFKGYIKMNSLFLKIYIYLFVYFKDLQFFQVYKFGEIGWNFFNLIIIQRTIFFF